MTLKPKTLELLAIDRASGELNPEAAELLAAYLEMDHAAAQTAREVEATLAVATKALKPSPAVRPALPPLRTIPYNPAENAPRWTTWNLVYGLAACLVVGFILGASLDVAPYLPAQPQAASSAAMKVAPANPVPRPAPSSLMAQAQAQPRLQNDFWAVRPWKQRREPAAGKNTYSLIWESPLKKPQWKENL